MKTSAAGRALIEQFEGCFLAAYDDWNDKVLKPGEIAKGMMTIGYGHTSKAGPPRVYIGMTITNGQADEILSADLSSVELEVGHLVKVPLTQSQFDALVSFQFNTGWLSHPHCSLLEAINKGQYQLADEDFMLYNRAQGKVLKGLNKRRKAEMKLFASEMTA